MKELEWFKSLWAKQISFFAIGMLRASETIIDKLDSLGAGEFVITMAIKIKRPIADTKELQQMLTHLK